MKTASSEQHLDVLGHKRSSAGEASLCFKSNVCFVIFFLANDGITRYPAQSKISSSKVHECNDLCHLASSLFYSSHRTSPHTRMLYTLQAYSRSYQTTHFSANVQVHRVPLPSSSHPSPYHPTYRASRELLCFHAVAFDAVDPWTLVKTATGPGRWVHIKTEIEHSVGQRRRRDRKDERKKRRKAAIADE